MSSSDTGAAAIRCSVDLHRSTMLYNRRFKGITSRSMLAGTLMCLILPLCNSVAWLRSVPLVLSPVVAQILLVGVDRLSLRARGQHMWATQEIHFIMMMVNVAASVPEAYDAMVVQRVYYARQLSFSLYVLITFSTQALGIALCILLFTPIRQAIQPPDSGRWFSTTMAQVILRVYDRGDAVVHRDMQYVDHAPMSFMQWPAQLPRRFYRAFMACVVGTLVYQGLMNAVAPRLARFNILCALGVYNAIVLSDSTGFGLLSISLDAIAAQAYLGPAFFLRLADTVSLYVGSMLIVALGIVLRYTDVVANVPIGATALYDDTHRIYDATRIVTADGPLRLDEDAYNNYSAVLIPAMVYMSYIGAFMYVGASMAQMWIETPTLLAAISTTAIEQTQSLVGGGLAYMSLIAALILCQAWNGGCSWTCVVVAIVFSTLLVVPAGVVRRKTGIAVDVSPFLEVIEGFMHSGDPITSIIFKLYGQVPISSCLLLYENIDLFSPSDTYQPTFSDISHIVAVHVWALMVSTSAYCGAGYIIVDMGFSCTASGWECYNSRMFFWRSVLWGLLGPARALTTIQLWLLLAAFVGGAVLYLAVYWVARSRTVVLALSRASIFPLLSASMLNTLILSSLVWCYVFTKKVQAMYQTTVAAGIYLGASLSAIVVSSIPRVPGWWGTHQAC